MDTLIKLIEMAKLTFAPTLSQNTLLNLSYLLLSSLQVSVQMFQNIINIVGYMKGTVVQGFSWHNVNHLVNDMNKHMLVQIGGDFICLW